MLTTEAIQGAKKFTAGWGRLANFNSLKIKSSASSVQPIPSFPFSRSGKFNVNKVSEPEVGDS